jgi:hypothetical protein
MIDQDLHLIDASSARAADRQVAPGSGAFMGRNRLGSDAVTGQNRLMATMNTGITTGVHAHAAVRMHVSPVFGKFWAYCPKSETDHFLRWKVAN